MQQKKRESQLSLLVPLTEALACPWSLNEQPEPHADMNNTMKEQSSRLLPST